MFIQPINKVVFANIELGTGCPTSAGPAKPPPKTSEELIRPLLESFEKTLGVKTVYLDLANREELDTSIMRHVEASDIVFSPDNAVSYAIIKCLRRKGWPVNMNLVFDQHMDIYSYRTHGKLLAKPNPYRLALDHNLLEFVLFLGARKLEMAFLEPFILLPEVLHFRRSPLDLLYAILRHSQGQHAGLKDLFSVIPAEGIPDFKTAVEDGLSILNSYYLADTHGFNQLAIRKKMRPGREATFQSFGFEIDLDAFDSKVIQGVDYGPHLPQRLRREAQERFQMTKLRNKNRALYNLIRDLWYISYYRHKIECPGIAVPDQTMIREAMEAIHKSPLPCHFFHITEFKPEFDSNGKTRELVKNLVTAAVEASRS